MISSSKALVRKNWVDACEFHDVTQAQVLRAVADRVHALKGQRPLVVLDLDSTLYEVGPRTHQILKEWAESEEARLHPELLKVMPRIEELHVGYSLRDTFGAIGIDIEDARYAPSIDPLKKFWAKRFFSSHYLKYDRPYPGAAEFARKLHEIGASIVYLTGRDEPNMGVGTREMLKRDGFPWELDRTHLILKDDFARDDLEHKQLAAATIGKLGQLVASFENEPKNLVALYEIFPDAMHVFIETVSSDHAAMPCKGLYRIQGFAD
jgi:hypothetical protein